MKKTKKGRGDKKLSDENEQKYQVSCRFFDYIVERVNLLLLMVNMEITQLVVSAFIDTYPLSISICCHLNHGKLLQLA